MKTGVIAEFSFDRGLGSVLGDDGATYPLHCTQIADGSRMVDAGARVTFEVLLKLGQIEATNVRAI
jgi:cold shock CspA family protein